MKHVITAALVLISAPAFAEPTFEGTGEAAIENGNKTLARQQALEAAMRDAVTKGAGAQLDTATVVEGGTLLQDKIFVHANGYVKKYDVAEDKEDDGVYRVKLANVVVGTGELNKDLAAVKAAIIAAGHPRLLMLIREQSVETTTGISPNDKSKDASAQIAQVSQGVVQQRLVQYLRGFGWKFVDPEIAAGKVHVENALTTDLASLNARDYATTGADYVVVGSVVVRPEKEGAMTGGAAFFAQLRTVLYVKATDNGETVASFEKSEIVKSVVSANDAATKALEQGGKEVADELQKQALETWRKNRMGVGNLHLYVSVADYDVLQAFEEQLQKAVANVKAVEEVSFNDGKADLSVSMAGTSTKQLAGSLSAKNVKGMQVKVTKVTANTLEVKLVR